VRHGVKAVVGHLTKRTQRSQRRGKHQNAEGESHYVREKEEFVTESQGSGRKEKWESDIF